MINLRGITILALLLALMCVLALERVHGRDLTNRYADSRLKSWFDHLQSKNGPCCSDADGTALSDVDWEVHSSTGTPTETNGVHYRVRIDRQWFDVPPDAVLTEPNRAGVAIVWSWRDAGITRIRCFIPGQMG